MKDMLGAVLDAALETGGTFAEVFLEDSRTHSLQLVGGHVETINANRSHGAGVRVFSGTNAIYAYTNDTSREGLLTCAAQAASRRKGAGRSGNTRANAGYALAARTVYGGGKAF